MNRDGQPSTPAPPEDGTVAIGDEAVPVWPGGQRVERWRGSQSVLVTRFADHDRYAAELRATVLARAADPELAQHYERSAGVGSAKVYDVARWPSPSAVLVDARARVFFRLATGTPAVVDLSWASVYRDGDYCLPHSHPRTLVSVLYVLDLGDTEAAGALNGTFLFVDPRLPACCREERGCMTTPGAPALVPGMMLLFPGKVVHCVAPYSGDRPRLTMSWDLNREAREGAPLPDWVRRPT